MSDINDLAEDLLRVDSCLSLTFTRGPQGWRCEIDAEGAEPTTVYPAPGGTFLELLKASLWESAALTIPPGMAYDDYELDETGNPVG